MKRSRYQIISQILEVCIGGANKTQIVYQANMNFKNASLYIDSLIDNGMINVKQGKKKVYETTEKGIGFLKNIKELNIDLSEIG